ncbi:hypothetical protein [Halorubellus salinus]|uniref:hypothetical protein n=1 Tax=Halorubellus salinus TaxID=755309 RepID=UPI001D0707D6|nr:hypothetical protein [Halorubellus salinus]
MDGRRAVAGGVALAVGVALAAVGRRRMAAARVDDVPLARVRSRGRVGADFHERSGLAGDRVGGELDDLDAFARDGFDISRVAPAVRRFYERTSEYRMTVSAEWHRPFRAGAALAAPVTSAVEQLNLPGPRERGRVRVVESDLYAFDEDAAAAADVVDPREDTRFWIRTDVDTGEAVFVAVYGSHVHDGRRYVNVAVPLPGGTLSTVLEPRALALADRDAVGVDLTTRAPGHPGLFWSTRNADYRLPAHQRFRVWPADAGPESADRGIGDRAAPGVDRAAALPVDRGFGGEHGRDGDRADAVVATHEMCLWDRTFLTVRYGAARRGD